jgi:RNA polymerase sigma-70 factor (ECF subfamily)
VTTATLERCEEALARLARGDATAFADIVQEHQSMVFSIAYHFLHDRSLAEEAAQDVFLRLYRNLASIKSSQHLIFWLRKVACRRALDEARKLPKAPPASLQDVAEPAAESPDPDPLLSRGLRRLVASLPEDARAVIILRYQEELDLAEIARILDLRLNTVKSRLERSLGLLREKLQRWGGGVAR